MNRTRPITGELLRLKDEIEAMAKGEGLDFHEVIYEICDYDTINILAAQGGLPTRYPHWRFGMGYDQFSKSHAYGVQKIYEMVVNTNPVYAYLLSSNDIVDQKIVMCHVFGHGDFFKNNLWFAKTNCKMMDVMANNGAKIRRYMEKYGVDKVETFIDQALSIDNLIDMNLLLTESHQQRKREKEKTDQPPTSRDQETHYLQSYLRAQERERKKKKKK